MFEILTIETPELGDRSYLVHDGSTAALVDPQRDLDRVLEALAHRRLKLELVLETHLHNDYVTGGLELCRRTGARYLVAGGEEATFDCWAASEGQSHRAGSVTFTCLATPGHTVGHASYLLSEGGRARAVFTGGSMLFGTVGRTDLVSAELTDSLTRRQYRSVRRLAAELDPEVSVHPTHGFGSFCSSSSGSGATSSSIGQEQADNVACRTEGEDEFVSSLLAGLSAYPAYYAHMGLLNRAGPAALDLSPAPSVSGPELALRLDRAEWVVDLRPRREYARSHLQGTVGAELDRNSFTTYFGWVVPWGTPLTLIGESADQVLEAQRDLARIGIDRPTGMAVGQPSQLGAGETASYPVATFADLLEAYSEESGNPAIVDVRTDQEWAEGHIRAALHLPLGELAGRIDEAPPGKLWVHCKSGFRASIGASLLARAGHEVVLIDDDWDHGDGSGLPIERNEALGES